MNSNIGKAIGLLCTGVICGYLVRYAGEPAKKTEKTSSSTMETSSKKTVEDSAHKTEDSKVQEEKKTDSSCNVKKNNNIISETTITKKDGTVIHSKITDSSTVTESLSISDPSKILALS